MIKLWSIVIFKEFFGAFCKCSQIPSVQHEVFTLGFMMLVLTWSNSRTIVWIMSEFFKPKQTSICMASKLFTNLPPWNQSRFCENVFHLYFGNVSHTSPSANGSMVQEPNCWCWSCWSWKRPTPFDVGCLSSFNMFQPMNETTSHGSNQFPTNPPN